MHLQPDRTDLDEAGNERQARLLETEELHQVWIVIIQTKQSHWHLNNTRLRVTILT